MYMVQARSIVEPFAYEEYRKNKIREKLEKERSTRIQKKKLPKVNKQLAERLLEDEGKRASLANPLGDDRFAAMFTNPDFAIDQDSEVWVWVWVGVGVGVGVYGVCVCVVCGWVWCGWVWVGVVCGCVHVYVFLCACLCVASSVCLW